MTVAADGFACRPFPAWTILVVDRFVPESVGFGHKIGPVAKCKNIHNTEALVLICAIRRFADYSALAIIIMYYMIATGPILCQINILPKTQPREDRERIFLGQSLGFACGCSNGHAIIRICVRSPEWVGGRLNMQEVPRCHLGHGANPPSLPRRHSGRAVLCSDNPTA